VKFPANQFSSLTRSTKKGFKLRRFLFPERFDDYINFTDISKLQELMQKWFMKPDYMVEETRQ
jgi:hypothetical protein